MLSHYWKDTAPEKSRDLDLCQYSRIGYPTIVKRSQVLLNLVYVGLCVVGGSFAGKLTIITVVYMYI
jgi:hypothetical protein